jgi:hypothetical protein
MLRRRDVKGSNRREGVEADTVENSGIMVVLVLDRDLNIPRHRGLLIVQACRRSLPVNLSQTREKNGEKGTECEWVNIIYHNLSLLEAQNVGDGLNLEKSLAEGLKIVP